MQPWNVILGLLILFLIILFFVVIVKFSKEENHKETTFRFLGLEVKSSDRTIIITIIILGTLVFLIKEMPNSSKTEDKSTKTDSTTNKTGRHITKIDTDVKHPIIQKQNQKKNKVKPPVKEIEGPFQLTIESNADDEITIDGNVPNFSVNTPSTKMITLTKNTTYRIETKNHPTIILKAHRDTTIRPDL